MAYKRTVWQDNVTPLNADNLNNIEEGLAAAAPLDSPTLVGTPTAPTPQKTDNSDAVATTAYVRSQTFVFDQMVPADTWDIVHDLNKNPSITVMDSAGSIVVGNVTYVSSNEVMVTFAGAFSGKAYLT